ncbi:hypothetical protein Kisp01_65580 [Kineosporia sp. NBRC 101677]|uniref:hypothetical protein n=1 Tax=Kineosporia sp. NBRC 101677 TaxID=3032197 RepID=UPI0024A36701|nr:hypothetical protein [Kineosporia sp. NBRC 101677]GLY19544.1 hypothetical protein Kisp01_65580 [Kineosporia sp. NBRC 101677]
MRGLILFLRARRAPMAMGTSVFVLVVLWVLWERSSDSPQAGLQMVVLSILLLVSALTMTLSGPDDELDETGAVPWPVRRAVHLLIVVVLVGGLMLITQLTGTRFGPMSLVLRDTAGLLGLSALSAAVIGTARAWFVPLGWTMAAVIFPRSDTLLSRVLTWQAQEPTSTAAAVTATVLALAGLIAYTVMGPARGAPAEAAAQ